MIIPDFYGILPYNRTGIHRTVVGANEVLFEILRHSPGPRGGSGARKKCDQGATRRGLGATKMSQQYRRSQTENKNKKSRKYFEKYKFFLKSTNISVFDTPDAGTGGAGRIEGATRRGLGATKMSQQYNNPKQKTKIGKSQKYFENVKIKEPYNRLA